MDIEFHYYMTYLIAARAGFSPGDAATIATASQEVDDNHIPIIVSPGTPQVFEATVSQTMDITRPHYDAHIYPVFHFIPGERDAPTARRQDGQTSIWMTTPNSPLANKMFDAAFASRSLHRIGASAHAYVDTWAHQNFIGREDDLNEEPGDGGIWEKIEGLVLKIGHGLAGHHPDVPDLIWTDPRLADPVVVNADRFLDAAAHLYRKFCAFTGKPVEQADIDELVAHLRSDIGRPSTASAPQDARIARYQQRALSVQYGGVPIPAYVEGRWLDAAFIENRHELWTEFSEFVQAHGGIAGDALTPHARNCTWNDPVNYKNTDWYKFQMGVKDHLAECVQFLRDHGIPVGA